jgi:4-carboxymuconolactone decarboxylase
LASLVTQGDSAPQLRIHIAGALRVGLRPHEIVEVVLQCLPFIGFPRVLNAMAIVREVLADDGGSLPE